MNKYNYENIKILKGLDAVKKRPNMYIGNTEDGSGLHQMFFEILDNSIDEVINNECNSLLIRLNNDNSISIEDNGRGIPTEIHKEEGISVAEIVMTVLHSGSKFDNLSYKISGGLHGVGLSVVNALSKKLKLIIYRDFKIYKQIYKFGIPINNLSVIGNTNKRGTYIKFWPDDINIFKNNNIFDFNIIYDKLNNLSFLNNNLNIVLINKNKKYTLFSKSNIKSLLKFIIIKKNNIKSIKNHNILYFNKNYNDLNVSVSLYWSDINDCKMYCFTNNIEQKEGGVHLLALKYSLTKLINDYINSNDNLYKIKNKYNIKNILGEDIRNGLFSIISVKFSNPKFSSQTKEKLISTEIKSKIENIIYIEIIKILYENKSDSKYIVNKILNSSKIRESIKNVKNIIKNNITNNFDLLGKLSNCKEKNPKLSELYIVEGDSAGGSAKQGRDRKFQAILPIKGKIINIEKSNFNKIIKSKEIFSIIKALGFSIKNNNIVNIDKLRYYKIIIMTDADVDGAHIKSLLLTFFYRYMKNIIKNGNLYIVNPPLYKIKINNKEKYLYSNYELTISQINISINSFIIYNELKTINILKIKKSIIKYIGLIKYYNYYSIYKKIIINSLINFDLIDLNMFFNKNKINIWSKKFVNYLNINNSYKFKYKIINDINNLHEIILCYNIKYKLKDYFIINYSFIKKYYKYLFFIKKNFNNKLYIKNLINNKIIKINSIEEIISILVNYSYNKIHIQRYKGLGEMNPNQLWDTSMNPNTRNIKRINIKDDIITNNLINILMSNCIELRKIFIEKYYNSVNKIFN